MERSAVRGTSAAPSLHHPLIAVAGLAIEASTFSPARTEAAAFHPRRGDEVFDAYPFMSPGSPLREAADWHGALVGRALPGGIVTRDAFESLTAEMLERLRGIIADHGPLDGLWFDIHGAMTVEGLDDAETVLLRRVREVIGPDVLVSSSMDLHGNVSADFVRLTDLITCYRMAPHEDELETKERATRNLVQRLRDHAGRPFKAWVPVPVLLPGEKTSTRVEPAKSIYRHVGEVAERPGVLDAAVWVGYAWADEPRNQAAVVVTGDDRDAVSAGAEELAAMFWAARDEFAFVAPTGTLDECLDAALRSDVRPYFISDSGDNPTAGGAGDVTWTLQRLLDDPRVTGLGQGAAESPRTVIYASLPAPEAVRTAVEAGVGATVTVTGGAAVDDLHAGPVTMTGVVHAIRYGDRDAKTEVVLRVGGLHVILTELRKPYHHEHDFTDLDLDPRHADIVIVKIGYLEPELFDMAADWMMALTPGGVDQDLIRLGHHRIQRPMVPYDPGDFTPDLHARMIDRMF
ncbi:M81 family metallopeptidase [Bifidobacterium leontopitheci]|uniref:MlrC domain-containing protein n=1 Tax=Bifidobacterium leontopitheci TaxID=2650774 RepID=A0A6I1GNS9_9BIFI|nr:M81 family metallopeptidase [Bifidobacterium leontopitheci]KAB7789728.1 MlrC domain-containing protein [Bifidobacterium leontopitheci]